MLDEAPIATISGSNTGLVYSRGIGLDSIGNIYVVNGAGVYCLSTAGKQHRAANVAPTATISGGDTGLVNPQGIALDSSGKIYVAERTPPACLYFRRWGAAPGCST